MPHDSWLILYKRGFSHILLVLVIAVFAGLGMGVGITTKSSVSPDVLGVPCQSGGLSTSINKVFQMVYRNETFLQLTNIDLLKDVSQLKDLTCLQYLDATDRTIKGDIANLKKLTNLEVLSLYSNPDVSGDICSLAEATSLRSLKLAFNPKITGDVSCLKNLTKLETFAMTDTQISGDLSVFTNMPNLRALYINGTNVKGDICSLSKLTNMEELGIADEVGNPDITGDLVCLDNLQKLKSVSLYNTGTTNCEQFTKSHQNLANTTTESGKQGGGGCSRESRQTLKNQNQKYERKIGKDVQTEVRGKPDYQRDAFSDFGKGPDDRRYEGITNRGVDVGPDNRNFLTKFIDWIKTLFSRPSGSEDPNRIRPQTRPGGCKSQVECDTFCDKPENKENCSKFTPPDSKNAGERESEVRPNLEQGGPGGCKSQSECEAFCSKTENREECSKFSPPGEGG